MDDNAQRQELERLELERARAKLTAEQCAHLDRIVESHLRQRDIYAPKHEIAIAHVLYDDRSPRYQKADIMHVVAKADNESRENAAKEQLAARAIEAERSKAAAAEELKRQELKQQEQLSARREPIPNAVQRFNAILAASTTQKARANEAGVQRLAERAPYRPDYARHDGLQASARGEISDAKAERLGRMFKDPPSDKGFDPTDTPSNTRSNGRGSR